MADPTDAEIQQMLLSAHKLALHVMRSAPPATQIAVAAHVLAATAYADRMSVDEALNTVRPMVEVLLGMARRMLDGPKA